MTQTISPQFHVIPDRESASAVFFFSFPFSQFPRELMEIHGVSPTTGGNHYRHSGRVIGGESGTPFALVIRAGPGTLIEMTPSERGSNFPLPIRLEVRNDMKIELANSRRSFRIVSPIAMNLRSSRNLNSTAMTLEDADLVSTFADMNLPAWLRETLDSQLVFWNKHHAKTYYQFTPWPVIGEEFARCVRAAPYWALARWQGQLFSPQIAYCMQRSPAGAVAYAIKRIPQAKRKDLILRFAGEALAHAADKLTDDEILACAQEDPYSALRERRKFIPEFRARILAQVIPMVRLSPVCIPGGLESDILESIAKFPSLWLDQYGTFVIAMDQIAKHLSIIPDGRTLEKLYHRMDPAGKDAYFHFMADRL
jgi:hypothetical protein